MKLKMTQLALIICGTFLSQLIKPVPNDLEMAFYFVIATALALGMGKYAQYFRWFRVLFCPLERAVGDYASIRRLGAEQEEIVFMEIFFNQARRQYVMQAEVRYLVHNGENPFKETWVASDLEMRSKEDAIRFSVDKTLRAEGTTEKVNACISFTVPKKGAYRQARGDFGDGISRDFEKIFPDGQGSGAHS